MNQDSNRVISERLEKRIQENLDFFYNVCVLVHYDKGRENECVFKENKEALLYYCACNQVRIYNPLEFLPAIFAKIMGEQIIELSTRDYIASIDLEDQPDFGAAR